MPKAEKIEYEYTGDVSSLKKATTKASSLIESFAKTAEKTFKSLTGVGLGDVFAEATKESIDYIENQNLFKVAMGESIDIGQEFVDTMSELYGMDPSNLMEYVGNFYQLTAAVDSTTRASEVMSLQLTKAAADIASVFNIDIESVIDNLGSGLRGMSRAVTKYGMDIRATTLQVTAASLGITKQVETMSEADREGLRYITMMRQADNIMGDFANTIESPANQLKIFKEQITQVGRAIGNFFLVPLKIVLPYINGFTMAVREMINWLGILTGVNEFVSEGNVSGLKQETDAVDSLGTSAEDTSKKLKKLTAPFDELNVINDNKDTENLSESYSMDPAIEKAVLELSYAFEEVKMKANEFRDEMLKFFGFERVDGELKKIEGAFRKNLVDRYPEWVKALDSTKSGFDKLKKIDTSKVVSALGNLKTSLSPFAATVGAGLADFFDTVLVPLSEYNVETIVPDTLNLISDAMDAFAEIWDVAGPVVNQLFADLLTPLQQVTWELIYGGLSLLVDVLESLADWARDDPESFRVMSEIVLGFLAGLWMYKKTKPILDFVTNIYNGLTTLTNSLPALSTNMKLAAANTNLAFAGFTLLAGAILLITQNWDKMNGAQRVIAILGAIAIGAAAAAAAFGALQSAWSLGVAAAAIVAGTVAIAAAVSAAQRDAKNAAEASVAGTDVAMATGGVVSGPTRALIGEGQYDEAVVPLGNSPQLNDMLDKFASKVSDRPVNVKVQIGEEDWDAFTYKSTQRGSYSVGVTPLGGIVRA